MDKSKKRLKKTHLYLIGEDENNSVFYTTHTLMIQIIQSGNQFNKQLDWVAQTIC